MSTEVEQKVVEMKFDNGKFERNASETLSTLDKLKQKLNFTGASKGLENVGVAAKNVNMSGLSGAVETVHAKFSALEVMGVTALANITNSAVNAGKRIVSALTIDPIKTGFQEYETQINATQTILANTESKGSTIDDVNKALDELNKYADLTIYNFTEMTRNIGTFTAAGVDLETSVNAIKGIANLAAVSGSTSQQASTAMYQLSQALASGTVKLMDWNSVVNAGMGGQVFQDALKETARVHGIAIDSMIEEQGSFRDTLSEGWLTSEILTETLQKFTLTTEGLTEEQIEANREMLRAKGYTEDQIEEIFKLGNTATDAATKVKTFSQMWDVMKESAQSGWSATWKILIGDFEQAKELLTPLTNFFTGMIEKMSDARNDVLESALGTSLGEMFEELREKIKFLQTPLENISDTIKTVTSTVEDLDTIANDVILGKFGNGADRVNALTEAGINYYKVQNKVNETLGSSFRYTDEQIEAQDKLLGITNDKTEATNEQAEATEQLSEYEAEYIEELATLTEAELKAMGYTDEQIDALKELAKLSDKLGISIKDLVLNMDEIDGRWLLLESLKNVGKGIVKVFQSIKDAWQEIFPPKSTEEKAEALFNLIAAFHKFSASLIMSEDTADNLKKTFKGLFAIIDIILTVVGGPVKVIFKTLIQVLKNLNVDILGYTAIIGDAIVALRDWVDEHNPLTKVIEKLVGKLPDAIAKLKAWFAAFKEVPAVRSLIGAIGGIRDAIAKLFNGEIDASEFARSLGANLAKALKALPKIALQIGKDFIAGFQNGIEFSFSGVLKKIINFCLNFVSGFAEALGVQSPSWKAYEIVVNFFRGAINAASDMLQPVIAVLKKIGEGIVKVFKGFWNYITDESGNVDWDKIITGGIAVALFMLLKKVVSAFSSIAGAFDGVGDLLSGAGKALNSFSKVLKGIAWDLKAKALLKMAAAVGILVAAIWVLTTIDDPAKLWSAVGVIAVLAAVVVGMALAMSKLSGASVKLDKSGLNIDGLKSTILQIGIAMLLLAATVKIIGGMDPEEAKQGFYRLAEMTLGMIAFIAAVGVVSKSSGGNVDKVGTMIKKLAVAMLLMVVVVKLVGGLKAEEMLKGVAFATAFAAFVIAITKVAKSAGNNVSKVGGMIIKLSIAMILLVAFCKLVNKLSAKEMLKGAAFATGFAAFVWALVKVTKIGKKQQLAKISGLVLSVSVSLMLLVGVCKLVGMLSTEELIKGAAFVAAFVVLLAVLKKVLTIGKEEQMMKVAGTILAMSVAIGILAAVSIMLGLVDIASLAKGVIAVGILSAMMALMIHSLKGAQNVKGSIIAMSVAIGVMVAAVIALSLLDTTKLLGSAAAISVMMAAFALMIKSLKGLNKIPVTPILTMIIIVSALATVLWLINGLDPLHAIGSAVALSTLMIVMAGVLKAISKMSIDGKNALIGVGILLTMAVPLLAFSIILRQMNGIEASIKTVGLLIAMMAAMTLLVKLLDVMNLNLGHSMVGILSLLAMAVPLLAFSIILRQMNGIEDAVGKVKALTILATACTLLLIPLTILGAIMVGTGGIGALAVVAGILALTAMAVPLLAFIAVLKKMNGIDNAREKIESLITAMTAMTALLVVLTVVGLFGAAAIVGIGSLLALFAAIGALAVGVGWLMEKCPSIETFLDKGLPILEKLAGSIGTMIGKFIGNIGEALSDSLVKIGEDISEFMGSIAEASDKAATIKTDSFDGVEKLMGILLEIGGTSIGTSVMDVFSKFLNGGKSSMDKFVDDAKTFFEGMKDAMEPLDGVTFNKEGLDSVIEFASKLAEFEHSLDGLYGVMSWLTGRTDLDIFRESAKDFFGSMKDAMYALNGASFNEEALNCVMNFSERLAMLEHSLDGLYGVMSWITGRSDLDIFRKNAKDFFGSMKDAMYALNGASFNEEALNCVMNFSERLAMLEHSLDGLYGVMSWITGRTDLDIFRKNAKEFLESMKEAMATLDGVTFNVEGLTCLICFAERLAALQDSIEGMDSFMGYILDLNDLDKFRKNAVQFIGSMKAAMQTLDGVTFNEEGLNYLMSFAWRLSNFQTSIDGLNSFIGYILDLNDLDKFRKNAVQFIGSMKAAMQTLDGVTFNEAGLDSIMKAAERLAEFQNNLEGMDGFMTWITGRTDLGTFGNNIYLFALGIGQLKEGMGENGISENVVTSVVNAGKAIAALQEALPEEHWFDGKMSLKKFSGYISDFAKAMKTFSDSTSDINSGAIDTSITTAYRIKELIEALVDLDTSGLKTFTGIGTGGRGADGAAYEIAKTMSTYSSEVKKINTAAVSTSVSAAMDLRTLINNLANTDTSGIEKFEVKSIGEAMSAYSKKVSGIDTERVTVSVAMAIRLKGLIAQLASLDTDGISKFNKDSVGSIGAALKSYYDSVTGVNAEVVYRSIVIANKVKAFISSLSNFNESGVSSFKSAVEELSKVAISDLVDTFSDASDELNISGGKMIDGLVKGIKSKKTTVLLALNNLLTIVKASSDAIRNSYESFYSAGSYVVTGFCNGIGQNTYKAAARAKAMAAAAVRAAKAELQEKSPSKVFYGIGDYAGIAFVNALETYESKSYDAGSSMAEYARNGISTAIQTINSMMDGDMDMQPTITPVIDLTDVETGVGMVNKLLNMNSSIGLAANVNTVNSTMIRRNQNGANDDVVAAIGQLRKVLSDNAGTTYNIDGITYDDGSAVANAIETITRAALIGRRV